MTKAASSEVAFIETHLKSGHEPELSRALVLLQQAVDLTPKAQHTLSQHLVQYLSEDSKTSHVVAALRCLYVFEDKQPFRRAFLHLGGSKKQRIRFAVASCLGDFGIWDESRGDFFADAEILDLAMDLTQDESPSIRDWAVFQFNNGITNDSAAIRKILRDRVSDKSLAVRQEAIVALTSRGETQYYSLIQEKLKHIDVARIWIEAAHVSRHKPFITDLAALLEKRQKSLFYRRKELISSIKEAINELDQV